MAGFINCTTIAYAYEDSLLSLELHPEGLEKLEPVILPGSKVENTKFKVVKFLGHNIMIGVFERQDPLRVGFLLYNTFEKVVMYDEDHETTANFFADDLHWTYGQTK
jgi:hypothetical protein